MLDHLQHLDADVLAVADVLRTTDPGSLVPSCPGWTLRDLAGHLGGVHRWGAQVVRTGEPGRPPAATPPDDELADWLTAGAAVLRGVLFEAGNRPCWTFGEPATARFWARRQSLETLLHRVDAQRAAGREAPVDEALAEDGIAEVLDVLVPMQVGLGRTTAPTSGAWLVTGTRRLLGAEPARTELAGPASAVLLLLWGRLPRTDPRLSATGDLAALDALLARRLPP